MVNISAILLIAGNILPELQGLLPETIRDKQIDLFLKPGFSLKISFAWWYKMLMDDLNSIIVLFILAMLVKPHSYTFFYIVCTIFMYRVVDIFLLLWNFKQTREVYWVLILASTVSIILLIKKQGLKIVR